MYSIGATCQAELCPFAGLLYVSYFVADAPAQQPVVTASGVQRSYKLIASHKAGQGTLYQDCSSFIHTYMIHTYIHTDRLPLYIHTYILPACISC